MNSSDPTPTDRDELLVRAQIAADHLDAANAGNIAAWADGNFTAKDLRALATALHDECVARQSLQDALTETTALMGDSNDALVRRIRTEQSERQAAEERATRQYNELQATVKPATDERDALQQRIDAALKDFDTEPEWWALSRGVQRVRTILTAPTATPVGTR